MRVVWMFLMGALMGFEALAAQPPSVMLEELTSTEVQQALKAGTATVIIPIGGTEQSGPHMALGKHNVRVKALAGKIAAFCLLYTSPSPRDGLLSRMPSSA